MEHIFPWSSLTVNSSVSLSSHLHNFSKFDFIALPVRCPGVCSFSTPFVVGIYFFAKKLDSHCAWYIASLATRSMLLDNRRNTSSAHVSALSWHLFKREVLKDKLPTLCQPLLQLGCFLSTTYTSLQKKKCAFQLKLFLSDRRTVDLTQLSSIMFSCFCFFRKGLVDLRLQFSWTNILHLACYFSLVPYCNSTDLHLNEFYCIQLNFAST